MIVREETPIKVVDIAEVDQKAKLECGHDVHLDALEGGLYYVRSGVMQAGKWDKWKGDEAKIGGVLHCTGFKCECLRNLSDSELS